MNARRATTWVAAALAVAGLACAGVRALGRRAAQLDSRDTLWRITYRAEFHAARAGAKLRVSLPADTAHARMFHEDVLYTGLTSERLRSSRRTQRELSLAAAHAGRHTLTARLDVHLSPAGPWRNPVEAGELTPRERDQYLRQAATQPGQDNAAAEIVHRLRGESPRADLLTRIHEFCHTDIREGPSDSPRESAAALRQLTATPLGRARAMVALCRAGGIPAWLVTGFRIAGAGAPEIHYWVEAHREQVWISCDPTGRLVGRVPHNLLPVRRDGVEVVRGSDISDLSASFNVIQLPPGAGAYRLGDGRLLAILDLTRLPLEMHPVLMLLLLVPLGALVTSFLRTVIGIPTFGTFTPALLALAFAHAEPLTGLLTFAAVLAVGLTSRSMVDRLKLLMVPRLSVILTLVVLCVVLVISVLDFFGLTPSAQAVVLPMVILTMTIERFYLTAEEDSARSAAQMLARTVLVSGCCYAVLRWETVGQIVLVYPELHLVTIALLVLLGRYSGYRLTELWRFRGLARESETP